MVRCSAKKIRLSEVDAKYLNLNLFFYELKCVAILGKVEAEDYSIEEPQPLVIFQW